MIDIAVKTVYGDYSIPWEEQEFQDERIETFKWQLADIINDLRINMSVILVIECEYYPATKKFKIIESTKNYRVYVQRAQDLKPNFVKEYLK